MLKFATYLQNQASHKRNFNFATMILDFTISNFRSIKEPVTLSFEATPSTHLEEYFVATIDKYRILKIATILGPNASGKSNVLRAFAMFPQLILSPVENKTNTIPYTRFALDPECADKPSEMIINFLCDNKKYRYEVHFSPEAVTYELLDAHPFGELRSHRVFERTLDPESMVSSIKWGSKYPSTAKGRDLLVNLLPNRTVFGSFQKSNIDIPWMKAIIDWARSYILPIVKTSEQHLAEYTSKQIDREAISKEQVTELMRRADVGVSGLVIEKRAKPLPPKLVDLILNDNEAPAELKATLREDPTSKSLTVKMAHAGSGGDVLFDFNEESNGTKRFYELSSILIKLTTQSHFVTIDELESKMHPDLYQHFLTTYLSNAGNSQMVFTTHIREFLNDKDSFRDDCVWFTEKNDSGTTELYSLADFGSDILRDSTNRYKAYRSGRLGAIPRLGATYINRSDNTK